MSEVYLQLADGLLRTYQDTGRLDILERVIALFRTVLATTPEGTPSHADTQANLGNALIQLYQNTGDAAALAEASTLFDAALAALDEHDEYWGMVLAGAGMARVHLNENSGPVGELDQGIAALRQALRRIPATHPNAVVTASHLGLALARRFERTGDADSLEEAITTMRALVEKLPEQHPDWPQHLGTLGTLLRTKSRLTEDNGLLAEAVATLRTALEATAPQSVNRGVILNELGGALRALARVDGRPETIDEAIQVCRRAVGVIGEGRYGRGIALGNLSQALSRRFEITGDVSALDEAVSVLRRALVATPEDPGIRHTNLGRLGSALVRSAELTGNAELLTEGLELTRQAQLAAPPEHPDRSSQQGDLASALQEQYRRTGRLEVLVEAVAAARSAAAGEPMGSRARAMYASNLAELLRKLSVRTGREELLAEAVEAGRVAASVPPSPERTEYLVNLALALLEQHAHTGRLDVLEEALAILREAAYSRPHNPIYRANAYANLAGALLRLADRTSRPRVLDEAIEACESALSLLPEGHPDRALCQAVLGQALTRRALATADREDHAEAVRYLRAAWSSPNAGGVYRGSFAASLGITLLISAASGQPSPSDTVAEAATVLREAVALTATDDPERALLQYFFGIALLQLSGQESQDARDEARECFRQAANAPDASTLVRLRSFLALGAAEADSGAPAAALAATERAVNLIDSFAPGSLARADREFQLGQIAGVAALAASTALSAGSPERAVELLEQARGVLVADSFGLRAGELARLAHDHPEPARRLTADRARLASLPTALTAALTEAEEAVQRTLADIRALPDFEDFLRPRIGRLAAQVGDRPVVIITSHFAQGTALVVTGDPRTPVRAVPLPDLTELAVHQQAQLLLNSHDRAEDPTADPMARAKAQQQILDVLEWLWDVVAAPVLAELGFVDTPGDGATWPRLWWSPVGATAFLPLHAAGHHRDPANREGGRRTVMDRVVASYTPTLRALPPVVSEQPTDSRTLVVTVPETFGAADGTRPEPLAIRELISDADILSSPTRAEVLSALARYQIAHFDCHGVLDANDPGRSHLVMSDYANAPLTVAEIGRLELDAQLAFLSACQTTMTSLRLADEAVHLTGAFQLAGYRHVIGTLWPVEDYTAAGLTDQVYRHLTHNGTTAPDPELAAVALHRAIRALRDHYPATPTLWAAHTHTGA